MGWRRPLWTIVVATLLVRIGLLALLVKSEAELVVSAYRQDDETFVDVSGRVSHCFCNYAIRPFQPGASF